MYIAVCVMLIAALVGCGRRTNAGCKLDDLTSDSSITYRVSGGYSEVRRMSVSIQCKDGTAVLADTTVYWANDNGFLTRRKEVPLTDYLETWARLDSLGVWDMESLEYPAEDAPVYRLTFRCGERRATLSVTFPVVLEDTRYHTLIKEMNKLGATLSADNPDERNAKPLREGNRR